MIADPPAPTDDPASLGEILTGVARRATDARLSTMMMSGVVGALIVGMLLGRKGWLGAAGLLAIGAYGAWGIADRRLEHLYATPGSPRGSVLAWRLARAIGAIVATLGVVSVLGVMFSPMFGLWRS